MILHLGGLYSNTESTAATYSSLASTCSVSLRVVQYTWHDMASSSQSDDSASVSAFSSAQMKFLLFLVLVAVFMSCKYATIEAFRINRILHTREDKSSYFDRKQRTLVVQNVVENVDAAAAVAGPGGGVPLALYPLAVLGFIAPIFILNTVVAPKLGLVTDAEEAEAQGAGYWVNGKYELYPANQTNAEPYDITKQARPYNTVENVKQELKGGDYDQPVENGDGATEYFFPPKR